MRKSNRRGPRFTATIAAGALALAGTTLALAGAANAAQAGPAAQTSYRFETLDNAHDVTFNQLLGINNKGLIAGVLRLRRPGPPEQGLPAPPALRAAQLRQRELPATRCRPRSPA